MKFLCVACDEPMKLNRTLGPDEGSMTIVYRCPVCENETAMLTNSMETQMVRALDIKIGGRSVAKEPMAFVKGALTGTRLGEHDQAATAAGATVSAAHSTTEAAHATMTEELGASKCPFTSAVNQAYADAESTDTPSAKAMSPPSDLTNGANTASSHLASASETTSMHVTSPVQGTGTAASEAKCPFPHGDTETADSAPTAQPELLTWTDEATERVERIPSYIRPMVMKGVEEFARSQGITRIDAALMEGLKDRFGGM